MVHNNNVIQMLMERHLSKKARRSSRKCHVKGPQTEEDDERFAQSFEKMLFEMAREKKAGVNCRCKENDRSYKDLKTEECNSRIKHTKCT